MEFVEKVMSERRPRYKWAMWHEVMGKPVSKNDHTLLPEDDPLWELIERCCNLEPARRPTIKKVLKKVRTILLPYLQGPDCPIFRSWRGGCQGPNPSLATRTFNL